MTAIGLPPYDSLEDSMGTNRLWYLSLTAFLLVASPWSAQAQTDGLKMVYAVWEGTGAAENTMRHMNKKTYDLVEAYAVLVKDKNGKVEVKQRHSQAGGSDRALVASETIDTAIARLSALPENAADSAQAYAPKSGPASHLSEKDLKRVVGMLNPNESAVLLISPKPNVSGMEKFLGMGGQGTPEIVQVDIKE
jgi:hypothetical protein